MGDEGLGGGTTRNRLQHRRLDFEKAVVGHEAAHCGDGRAAGDEGLAGRFIGNQIDMALAIALLLVGQAMKLVGQRPQRLGQQTQRTHPHRQLALHRPKERAFGGDDVAEVPVLEGVVRSAAHTFIVDPELQPVGRVLEGGKARLALDPLEHHATGDRDLDRGRLERLAAVLGMRGQQRAGAVGRHEVVGIGDAGFTQTGELGAPLGDDLVLVDRRGGGIELCGGRGGD